MVTLIITGGIATGKSTAAKRLTELCEEDCVRFDCDAVAHDLLTKTEISQTIEQAFGREVFASDATVDRGALRTIVFSDDEKRERLESILHPHILERALSVQSSDEVQSAKIFLVEVPLFYEVDFPVKNDGVVAIATTRETQTQRLKEHRNLDEPIITKILNSQLPILEKVEKADFVVWNQGSSENIDHQLRNLLDYFKIATQ